MLRSAAAKLLIAVVAVVAAEFVLLRIVVPDAINAHSDLGLALAVGGWALAAALAIWIAQRFWRHYTQRTFR